MHRERERKRAMRERITREWEAMRKTARESERERESERARESVWEREREWERE